MMSEAKAEKSPVESFLSTLGEEGKKIILKYVKAEIYSAFEETGRKDLSIAEQEAAVKMLDKLDNPDLRESIIFKIQNEYTLKQRLAKYNNEPDNPITSMMNYVELQNDQKKVLRIFQKYQEFKAMYNSPSKEIVKLVPGQEKT